MNNNSSPVLFIIFNRLNTTQQVFEAIRKYQPARLFIASDGPRQENPGEAETCIAVRSWILANIDWKCDINTFFRNQNNGCGIAVSTAITWFFDHVEEGIIIEDDCVPHQDFFGYCTELLDKYRYDDRIAVIGGNNFQNGKVYGNKSYYFSKYSYTWGWATWRRVWKDYQFNLICIDKNIIFNQLDKLFSKEDESEYWKTMFTKLSTDNNDTWDYQLWFHIWNNKMVSIVPNVNLVKNIGFFANATHTTDENSDQAFLETYSILPLKHPGKIKINHKADSVYFKKYWDNGTSQNFFSKLIRITYKLLPSCIISIYGKIKKVFR